MKDFWHFGASECESHLAGLRSTLLTLPCVLFFLRSIMEPNFIAEFRIFLLKVFSKAFRERCQAFLIRAWLQNGSTLSNSVSHFLPASKSLRSDHPVEVYRLSLDFKVVWKSLKLLISNQRFLLEIYRVSLIKKILPQLPDNACKTVSGRQAMVYLSGESPLAIWSGLP